MNSKDENISFTRPAADLDWFKEARYGLFMHYGLYSLLGRGDDSLNRERLQIDDYKRLTEKFTAERLNFDDILKRAKNDWGMRYAILTQKHGDGFCLFDSKLTDFTSVHSACKRDLTAEFVEACHKYNLRFGMYLSLRDPVNQPSEIDALEQPAKYYQQYIDFVHGQIRELLTNYGKVDVMWYDGWWPFDGQGWQAEKLNAMVRSLQPDILINSRCGIRGDFDTPEQHIQASEAGRPWEACMTLNDCWGYHKGDHNWKSPKEIAEALRQCAAGCGNLLLDVGPAPEGAFPEPATECLNKVGKWLNQNGESIFNTDRFVCSLHKRSDTARSDFTNSGKFTASGNAFYWHIRSWPGMPLRLSGLECEVTEVSELSTRRIFSFSQDNDRLIVKDVPEEWDTEMPVVFRFRTKDAPRIYRCGGYRTPKVDHCRYDPTIKSDMVEIL